VTMGIPLSAGPATGEGFPWTGIGGRLEGWPAPGEKGAWAWEILQGADLGWAIPGSAWTPPGRAGKRSGLPEAYRD
jgi:hypothetical protein